MSRTRGASNVIHQDDGELLDKEGKPLPSVVQPATWTGVAQQPNPEVVEAEPPEAPPERPPSRYRCDATTIGRDMDGAEAFRVIDVLLGGLSGELDEETFMRLQPDVRRHFRRLG